MHMACRRGDSVLVKHLVALGASMQVSDDFGRTPLHDACWTPEPCFDVVIYLLQHDIRLLRLLDRRGSSPLAYVRNEHHPVWCAFFDSQKDNFWRLARSCLDRPHSVRLPLRTPRRRSMDTRRRPYIRPVGLARTRTAGPLHRP